MIPVQQAEELILQALKPIQGTIKLDLRQCAGYVLAQEVASEFDFPYWDNSAMDGYAVIYEDVKDIVEPVCLKIVEEIAAGKAPQQSISKGEAARIFTGAVLPVGADTIVIQEQTQRKFQQVFILSSPSCQGAFVRKKGDYYKAKEILLQAGHRITPQDIPLLALAQLSNVNVYRKPKVAIFSTGDELKEPGSNLKLGEIIDSNQYALAAYAQQCGCEAICLGIVPDQVDKLQQKITQALDQSDLVISTGGVSVGDYDYVESILTQLGAQILIDSVAIKPGKPLTVASFDNGQKLYFGIPGNPVSAMVIAWRLLTPALKKLAKESNTYQLPILKARANSTLTCDGKRETYLCGQLEIVDGFPQFTLSRDSQSSANLIHLSQTNALAIIPLGCKSIDAGENVQVLLLSEH